MGESAKEIKPLYSDNFADKDNMIYLCAENFGIFMKTIELWRRFAAPAALCALAAASVSCVNDEYDFGKEMDLTAVILQDVTLPVGNVRKLYLKDILFGEDESMVTTSPDGDCSIMLADGSVSTGQSIPRYEHEGFSSDISIAPLFSGEIGSAIGNISGTADLGTVHFLYDMETYDLPLEITGLKLCKVSSTLRLVMAAGASGQGSMVLEAGAEMIFPDYLVIVESALPRGIRKTGTNTYVTTQDFSIMPSVSFYFQIEAIDFDKAPAGQGLIEPGHFKMKSDVLFTGSIRAEDVPASVVSEISGKLLLGPVRFVTAQAKISKEAEIHVSPITVDGIPDFLDSEGAVIDLRGLRLDMSVANSFPIGGKMSVGITTERDSEVLASVSLGPVGLAAPALGESSRNAFSFSQAGTGAPSGYSDVKTENFDVLLRMVPQTVNIHDMKVVTDDKYAEIEFGEEYSIDAEYSLYSPLSFGPDMHLEFWQDMTGLGIDLSGFGLKKALLALDAVNSIPIELELEAEAIDFNGNRIPGLDISLDRRISAGSVENPSVSALLLSISSDSGALSFDGLRLRMSASAADAASNGARLNMEQGISLENLVLRVPEGITVDLGGNEN